MQNTQIAQVKNTADNQENFNTQKVEQQQEKTIFVRSGDNIYLSTFNPNEKRVFELSAGFYNLEWDALREVFYLRLMELQSMPEKIYGDVKKRSARILNTFNDRNRNTGVLLHGMKGTGKSLLSRQVCIDAVAEGKPVIFIATPYAGPKFVEFMENITQSCVINIDEFEKTYGGRESGGAQEGLLSMMDGIGNHNKLWLLTVNETSRVNQYMMNRPSRLFYKFEYGVIPVETVEEVCEDKGLSKEQTENLVSIYTFIEELTFDVLMAIIEESKRYKEMPQQAVKLLNIDIAKSTEMYYPEVRVFLKDQLLLEKSVYSFNTNEPYMDFEDETKGDKEMLARLVPFRKDYQEAVQEADNSEEGEGDDVNVNDYSNFELELVHVNGRKGIREYILKNMANVGIGEHDGKSYEQVKIVISPKKYKKADTFAGASAYSSGKYD